MQTFKDIKGGTWSISFSIGEMRRIEKRMSELGMPGKITAPADTITRIQDPASLADILFVCCEPQARENGVTSEAFGYLFAGDTITEAKDAFLKEYIDFFPKECQREKYRALAESADRIGDEVISTAVDTREESMEALRTRVIEALKEASGRGSTNPSGSSE